MRDNTTDDVQPSLIAAFAITLALAYISVALRMLARWRVRSSYEWDDWAILTGLVCYIGQQTGG